MEKPLYDRIGDNYNTSRRADPYLLSRLLALVDVQAGGLCLDIGCGTGNYTLALSTAGLKVTGGDPSEKMLADARRRSGSVDWVLARAEDMPFSDAYFDGICGVLTVHHWKDIATAFRELHRVLQPGGRLVLFTSSPVQMRGYWLNEYFPEMLKASITQMPEPGDLEALARIAGFTSMRAEKYSVRPDLADMFLYCGKDRPEVYSDKHVRAGISSFAALAWAGEVLSGLEKLHADVDSGAFASVRAKYENDLGDYLFLVFRK